MSGIERGGAKIWTNEHHSRTHFMRRSAEVRGPHSPDLAVAMAARRTMFGDFIAHEVERGREICVPGSSWSQSALFRPFATLLDTDADKAAWAIPDSAFIDGITDKRKYVMVAGGTKVVDLMRWLETGGRKLSLSTAGSHKGQSVAGIVATGSHGSTLEYSGCEQHVRGILLSTGKDMAVWLGDPAKKLLNDSFVGQFATLGDPKHFPAAMVHLGGMGIVSALLLEVVDEYHVGLVKRVRQLPADWADLVSAARFNDAIGPLANGRTPHFYEITLDPFGGLARGGLETIWLSLGQGGAAPVAPAGAAHQVRCTGLELICDGASDRLAEIHSTPSLAKLDFNSLRELLDVPDIVWDGFAKHEAVSKPDTPHRLSQLCADWTPRKVFGIRVDVYNAAFAVPLDRLGEALDIGVRMARGDTGPKFSRDFVFTVRFARRSPASMGFLRFERTAIINIDGLPRNFILGSDAHVAARRLQYLLDKAGLPFSMHWGKDAQCSAAKIKADYGSGVAAWRAARKAVLGANASLFGSPALEEWGLV